MSQTKKNAQRERDSVLEYLNTEGARAAAEAAVRVCQDPKASPQAVATASATILRTIALGGFGKNYSAEPSTKEPHEMTPEERAELLKQLYAEQAAEEAEQDEEDGEGGPFG